jgi:hypothetical protein
MKSNDKKVTVVLTDDTKKVIHRSLMRPFADDDPNLVVASPDGEDFDPPSTIKSRFEPFADDDPILRAESPDGEGFDPPSTIKSRFERPETLRVDADGDGEIEQHDTTAKNGEMRTDIFDPGGLVGRTFLVDDREDGQSFVEMI